VGGDFPSGKENGKAAQKGTKKVQKLNLAWLAAFSSPFFYYFKQINAEKCFSLFALISSRCLHHAYE
jgi:hypothetical protein